MLDLSKVEKQALARYTNDEGNHVLLEVHPAATLPGPLRILFIADVFGAPGRRALEARLAGLRDELAVDFCIVNGENAADGRGITAKLAERLLAAGADVITLGNWAWGQQGFGPYLSGSDRVIRPANMSPSSPGRGLAVHDGVAVINLLGQMTLNPFESAFVAADRLVDEARRETPVIVVDFHAEATSEKVAMARHLDGRVTAVIGTHTHVQTNDARVLAGGTAAITDAGMTGPHDSVIGSVAEGAIRRFVTGLPDAARARLGRRPDRGRARRVRRRRPRYELRARARPGRLSTASSATQQQVPQRARPTRGRSRRRSPSSGSGTTPAVASSAAASSATAASPRRPPTRATSGTSQIRYCGESTLPKTTNAQTHAAA